MKLIWRVILAYAVVRGVYRGVRGSIQEAQAVECVSVGYAEAVKGSVR